VPIPRISHRSTMEEDESAKQNLGWRKVLTPLRLRLSHFEGGTRTGMDLGRES
jgi:hypothetical protein